MNCKEDQVVRRIPSIDAKNLWAGYTGDVTNSFRFKDKEINNGLSCQPIENQENNMLGKKLLPYQLQKPPKPPSIRHYPTILQTSSDGRLNILKNEIRSQENIQTEMEHQLKMRAERAEKHVRALLKINQQMASYMQHLYIHDRSDD